MDLKKTEKDIQKSFEQQPAKESVVANKPLIKKSFKKKLAEAVTHDTKESIFDYLIFSVVVPNLMDLGADILHSATDSIIYGIGDSRRSSRIASSRGSSRVDNVSYSRPSATVTPYNTYGRIELDEIIYRTKVDAERALRMLRDDIEMYDKTTVCALKEASGVEPQYIAPIDHDYGWTDLGNARVQSTRDGYILVLPSPIRIGRK